MSDPGDLRPIPDPTSLTTEQLLREIAAVKESHAIDVRYLREAMAEVRNYFETILSERDKRYQAAFTSSEKATTVAFEAREQAVKAAMDASEKAIAKAEASIEKRADTTYVTITSLQDKLSELMPRAEAEGRFTALGDRATRIEATVNLSIQRPEYDVRHLALQEANQELARRLTVIESTKIGGQEATTERQASNASMYALAGFVLTLLIIGGILVAYGVGTK